MLFRSRRDDHRLTWLVSITSSIAIVTGTVVTGSGPHAGDEKARRLPFEIETVARFHGTAVIIALLSIVAFILHLRRTRRLASPLATSLETVLGIGVVQGAVGYTQYFAGIPAALVGVHIALATAFFAAVVNLHLTATGRIPTSETVGSSTH